MQIYKNVPRIGFFVKAGGRFAKRMETHKFVHTILLIGWEVSLLQELWQLVRVAIQSSLSAKSLRLIIWYNWIHERIYTKMMQGQGLFT